MKYNSLTTLVTLESELGICATAATQKVVVENFLQNDRFSKVYRERASVGENDNAEV